jgi:hypothetical protein
MRIDRVLILTALKAAHDDGVAALPVLDAMIAKATDVHRAAARMLEAYEMIVGTANRCHVKIKSRTVPHMGEGGWERGRVL